MKSEAIEIKKCLELPKLMKHVNMNFVVLVYSVYGEGKFMKGTVVSTYNPLAKLGEKNDYWNPDFFVDFYGKVTLTSE